MTSEILEDILNDLPKLTGRPKIDVNVEINCVEDQETEDSIMKAAEKFAKVSAFKNDEKETNNESIDDHGVVDLTSNNEVPTKKSVDPDEDFLTQTKTDLGLLLEGAEAQLSLEECPTCKSTLEFSETFQIHMRNEHSGREDEPTPHTCTNCGGSFATISKLEEHVLTEHALNLSHNKEKREFARNEDGIRECARCDEQTS